MTIGMLDMDHPDILVRFLLNDYFLCNNGFYKCV